jgi:hypothetical protein
MEFGLVDADHVFVEELYEGSKTVWKAGMGDELTLERNTPLIGGGIDHVNEMPVHVNLQDGLSQQLESGREYEYDEKVDPIVEPYFDLNSAVSSQEEMNIQSFLRMPVQDLILDIGRHGFGHENGTLVALEEMIVQHDNCKRCSSTRYIDVTPDHLCEDAAAWSVFPEAAHSSKQGISVVYLAHKAFPSGFLCFRGHEKRFCPWNQEAICLKISNCTPGYVLRQVDTKKEGERPWDPGISGSCMLRDNEGGMWRLLQQAGYVRMQWDLGISTATAWGHAVFRGAGNVTTQIRPRRSPFAKSQSSPAQSPSRGYFLYKPCQPEERASKKRIRNRSGCALSSSATTTVSRPGVPRRRPQESLPVKLIKFLTPQIHHRRPRGMTKIPHHKRNGSHS